MGADSFPAATCLPATSNRRVLVVKLHVTSFWCRSLGHSASMITSLPALRHDIPMSAWKQCCSQAQVCIEQEAAMATTCMSGASSCCYLVQSS